MAIEEAEYTVVLKEENFELRKYEPHILAETIIDGDFEEAGSEAFGRLFDYISGNNKSRQKVAMTSPVSVSPAGWALYSQRQELVQAPWLESRWVM